MMMTVNGLMLRIIPADAGSTWIMSSAPLADPDHPRGCGEHEQHKDYLIKDWGSSPRMRGARKDGSTSSKLMRIIPADAGSTYEGDVAYYGAEDHPRGCGEHMSLMGIRPSVRGSSPRMRGAR